MRIATYEHAGAPHLGLLGERGVRPLPDDLTMLGLLAAGQAGRGAAAAAAGNEIGLGEVRLLPPLHPPSMRDFVSFEAHVAGVRRAVEGKEGVPESWYEQPTFMFMSPHAVVGANDLVPIPAGCKLLDYELEVAAVIGQDGRDLTPKAGSRAHRRCIDPERLVSPRPAVQGDAQRARPGQGEGFRFHPGPVHRDRRRAGALSGR